MSGVLDRMVQRSRGTLPAIEPLVRAQQTAAAALPVVVEESAAAPSRGRNAASAEQKRAVRIEPAPTVRDLRHDAAQGSEPAKKDVRPSEAFEEADRVKGAAERDETGDDGSKSARPEWAVELWDLAQESEKTHESSIEMRAEKTPAKPEEIAREDIRTRAKGEQRPAAPHISAVRNETGDAASTIDPAEHTEIHITIGSVELRAPRLAPVLPKAPAFRPRVTLDEFLKRRAGSGGGGAKS